MSETLSLLFLAGQNPGDASCILRPEQWNNSASSAGKQKVLKTALHRLHICRLISIWLDSSWLVTLPKELSEPEVSKPHLRLPQKRRRSDKASSLHPQGFSPYFSLRGAHGARRAAFDLSSTFFTSGIDEPHTLKRSCAPKCLVFSHDLPHESSVGALTFCHKGFEGSCSLQGSHAHSMQISERADRHEWRERSYSQLVVRTAPFDSVRTPSLCGLVRVTG